MVFQIAVQVMGLKETNAVTKYCFSLHHWTTVDIIELVAISKGPAFKPRITAHPSPTDTMWVKFEPDRAKGKEDMLRTRVWRTDRLITKGRPQSGALIMGESSIYLISEWCVSTCHRKLADGTQYCLLCIVRDQRVAVPTGSTLDKSSRHLFLWIKTPWTFKAAKTSSAPTCRWNIF